METIKLDNVGDLIPENYTGIVEYNNGTIMYFLNSKRHREDGPAVIYTNGLLIYYLNGKHHREDGPAVIWNDGTKYYYIHDNDITKEVNEWLSGETDIPPYEK